MVLARSQTHNLWNYVLVLGFSVADHEFIQNMHIVAQESKVNVWSTFCACTLPNAAVIPEDI